MLQESFFDPKRQNIQEFLMKPRKCDGCAVTLQFFDENESGFIDYQIFKSFLENEILFSEKKKREVEELVFDRSLLNRHMKLPSKKFLKVIIKIIIITKNEKTHIISFINSFIHNKTNKPNYAYLLKVSIP